MSPRVVASIVVERRAASFGSTYSVSNTVGHLHPSRSRIGWEHGVKARPGVCGCPVKPRATSLDRKSEGINQVNPPSSATGVTRGGKSPSRVLPAEGGRIRTSSPQPRSESAGGADRSPEGDLPRRRGQTRESGDAGGRATPDRQPLAVAAIGGKPTQHPDEGAEFTQPKLLIVQYRYGSLSFLETWGFAISFATCLPGNRSEYIHVEGVLIQSLTLRAPQQMPITTFTNHPCFVIGSLY